MAAFPSPLRTIEAYSQSFYINRGLGRPTTSNLWYSGFGRRESDADRIAFVGDRDNDGIGHIYTYGGSGNFREIDS